jgi:threonine dehydratase
MTRSLQAGRVVELDSVGLFADGAAVKRVGEETFRLSSMCVDEMVLVSTDEICTAIKDAFSDTRVVLEPAGALGVAGMKKWAKANLPTGVENPPVLVCIASGANMDFDRLRFVSERADSSESLLYCRIPETAGSFNKLVNCILPRNITEFCYRISEPHGGDAHIFLSFQALQGSGPHSEGTSDRQAVIANMENVGLHVVDLEHNELAKVHGRHMVGGRAARSLCQDEILIRFEFPERPGSLRLFLERLPPKLNVSLFHYRNHGSDVGRVLVGVQVAEEERQEFWKHIDLLGYHYTVESENTMYQAFLVRQPKTPDSTQGH